MSKDLVENAPEVRGRICARLERLGLRLDGERNARMISGQGGEISAAGSTSIEFERRCPGPPV